jgi:hypothetical protein
MEKNRYYNEGLYKDYDDWYDNGPGSEAFKRKLASRQKTFPDLVPTIDKVLTEESYRSAGRGVNEDYDMMRITICISVNQWRAVKQKLIWMLHQVRIGGKA